MPDRERRPGFTVELFQAAERDPQTSGAAEMADDRGLSVLVEPQRAQAWSAQLAALLDEPPDWLAPLVAGGACDRRRTEESQLAARIRRAPTLVIGFGGSSLGLKASVAVAARDGVGPDVQPLRVLDSLDGLAVRSAFDWARAHSAQTIFISKSGQTVEVMALLELAIAEGMAPSVVICGPGRHALRERVAALKAESERPESERACIEVEISAETGGRYSVFGPVCQVPMLAMGLDGPSMAEAARGEIELLRQQLQPMAEAPGERAALRGLVGTLEWRRQNPAPFQVIWCYDEPLLAWAHWLQQLDCESLSRKTDALGRHGEFVAVLRGPADQHSVAQHLIDGPRDKRVTIVDFDRPSSVALSPGRGAGELAAIESLRVIEREATHAALPHPRRSISVHRTSGPNSLAILMLHSMLETVLWADEVGFSPYGQPGVELIKRQIHKRWPKP